MNKELQYWINGMLVSIQNAIDRMNEGTLSANDKNSLGVSLIQLGQELKNDPEYADASEHMDKLAAKLSECFSALMDDNAFKLQENKDELRQIYMFGDIVLTKEDYDKFQPREDGRTYIDMSKLPQMSREKFMEYVDRLKSMGAKFDKELKQWYVEKDWIPSEAEKTSDASVQQADEKGQQEEKSVNEQSNTVNEEVKIKAIYYMNSNREELFAATKEEALKAVKEARKTDLKEKERCYIQEYDGKSDSYKQEGIYLIASGKDITPVELKLPYMSEHTFHDVKDNLKSMGAKFNVQKKMWYVERAVGQETIDIINDYLDKHDEATYLKLPSVSPDEFKKIVTQIKEAGAKYNGDKKAWYITDKVDQSKFADYLDEEKKSVREKLGQYKAVADGQKTGNEHEIEARNNDVQER